MAVKNNWAAMRIEYIRGGVSLRDIAKKYEVHPSSVYQKAQKDGWAKKRDEYMSKIVNEALVRVEEKDTNKMLKMIESADKMVEHIEKALADGEQFQKYIVNDIEYDDEGNPSRQTQVEKVFSRYDTRAMREMSSALKEMTSVIRNVNNIPTDAEAQQLAMAREKHKKDMDREESSKDIVVRFEGDIKEWAE